MLSHLATLFEHHPAPVLILDESGNIRYVNSKLRTLCTVAHEGCSWQDCLLPITPGSVLFCPSGTKAGDLYCHLAGNQSSLIKFHFSHLEAIGWILTGAEINQPSTPAVPQPLPLALEKILEVAQFGIWQTNAQGETTFANSAMAGMLGYLPEEMLGQALFQFMDSRGLLLCGQNIASRISGQAEEHSFEFTHRDGHRLHARLATTPLWDEQGRYQGAFCVVAENEVEHAYQEALEASERRYATLVNQNPSGVLHLDASGRGLYANPAWLRITGLSVTQVAGDNWWVMFNAPERELIHQRWQMQTESGYCYEGEHEIQRPDGQARWVLLNCQALFDQAGDVSGYVATVQDITALKEAEQAARIHESRWRFALEAAAGGVYEVDFDLGHGYFSPRFEELFGETDGAVVSIRAEWLSRIHPSDSEQLEQAFLEIVNGLSNFFEARYRLWHPDHGWRWMHDMGQVISRNQAGQPSRLVGLLVDISEQMDLDAQKQLAASVFHHGIEGIMITDARTQILSVNESFCEMTGYSEFELKGNTPQMLQSGLHDRMFYGRMWQSLHEHGKWQGEVWDRRKSGEIFPVWLAIKAVQDKQQQTTHFIAFFRDISEAKAANERIYHLAHYDALTDLPNRMLLQERLKHAVEVAKREQQQLAVFFLDLDRFKLINDTLGHMMGDRLLQQVARRLADVVRKVDTVARLGGDEFVIIVTESSSDAAVSVAKKIIATLSTPFQIDNQCLHTSTSIGISMYPHDSGDVEDLIKHADTAMYCAKDRGRNNYQFFTPSMNAASQERHHLEEALRCALEKGEFDVTYQPQINIRSGRIVGVEALLRWSSATLGVVPPRRFIPIAEELGLMQALGEWVLSEACHQAKRWLESGLPPVTMCVNLANVQFKHPECTEIVARVLQTTGLDPASLEIELTERLLNADTRHTTQQLAELAGLGIRLSIDDFGSGYSSLAVLKEFPISRLKMDPSFIRDLNSDLADRKVVRAIIQLAHSLQLRVLAEGVENAEQLAFLLREGCDEVQGYHHYPALHASEVAALLREEAGFH